MSARVSSFSHHAGSRVRRLSPVSRVPALAVITGCLALSCLAVVANGEPPPVTQGGTRGPLEMVFSRDGKQAYIAEFDTSEIAVIDVKLGSVTARIPSGGEDPTALALMPDDQTLLVTNSYSGSLGVIDLRRQRLVELVSLRGMPLDVVVSQDGDRAYVSLSQLNQVVALDTDTWKERGRVTVGNRPELLAITQNGRRVVSANTRSGDLSVIDTDFLTETRRLPTRGVNLRGLALVKAADLGLVPDVTVALVSCQVPNAQNNALQPEDGQIWSNFIAAVPVDGPVSAQPPAQIQRRMPPNRFNGTAVIGETWLDPAVTVPRTGLTLVKGRPSEGLPNLLLQEPVELRLEGGRPSQGRRQMMAAADPMQIVAIPNQDVAFVANGGIQSVSAFSLSQTIAGGDPTWPEANLQLGGDSFGRPLQRGGGRLSGLGGWGGSGGVDRLGGPEPAGGFWGGISAAQKPVLRQRVGVNPRAIALTPDHSQLWVANHLGSSITVLDAERLGVLRTIDLGRAKEADPTFAGRVLFHDGFAAREQWFSCNSCHPDGMTDGRSWRFAHVPDNFAELRNTRLLRGGIQRTAPFRWSGHDDVLEKFAQEEVIGLLKGQPRSEAERQSLAAYLASLRLPPNPHRNADGTVSAVALTGRTLFMGKAGCVNCHSGAMFGGTGKQASIGTLPGDRTLDVPHLAGVLNSGPYLHDGRAGTLEAVFQKHNTAQRHGDAHLLTQDELSAVLEFVREL